MLQKGIVHCQYKQKKKGKESGQHLKDKQHTSISMH